MKQRREESSLSLKLLQKLAEELAEVDEFRPVNEFARKLNVSKRTIYSYVNQLEDSVKEFGCSINKVPGKGIILVGKKDNKKALLDFLKNERYPTDLSPIERRRKILYRLLHGEIVSYNELAENYYVSRSSIVSDMKWIKDHYFIDNLDVRSNSNGTFLKGTEREIQIVWAKLMADWYEEEAGEQPSSLSSYADFYRKKYPGSADLIEEVRYQVKSLGEDFHLPDYYLISLFESLVLLCMRVDAGYHHEKEDGYVFEKVENLDTYVIAGEIVERLSSTLDINFSSEDSLYLNECFIANGLREADTSKYASYYEKIVDNLISKFSTVINLDLSKDEKFRKGLLKHLVPMYFRIQQGINLQNPYIQEIKKQYSMMFHLTWFLLVDLENELKKRIPEDEIGFMMVHFQSALERNRDIKKIVIVSQTGLLTSELLEMRVKKALPSIHVYETISENEVKYLDLTKVDLVLSTVALEVDKVDVLRMSTIPTDDELQEISHYITKQFSTKNGFHLGDKTTQNENSLHPYLKKNQIICNEVLSTPKEVIRRLVRPLEETGAVKEEYLSSVLDREQLSSTAFETGVAIPHGNPEFVTKTTISIYVSEHKINWGNEKVDVVILFSVAKEDVSHLRTIIEPIYEMIYSRSKVENVFKKQSHEGIYQYLISL